MFIIVSTHMHAQIHAMTFNAETRLRCSRLFLHRSRLRCMDLNSKARQLGSARTGVEACCFKSVRVSQPFEAGG